MALDYAYDTFEYDEYKNRNLTTLALSYDELFNFSALD